jgi:hypothetical protein
MDMYSIYRKTYHDEVNGLPGCLVTQVPFGFEEELEIILNAYELASHGEFEYYVVKEG